ncbi:MAG: DUF2236 domain-containing protein [Hyphomonadaceae bacterium]|nr:DUF2236 domain-containing protein [Hyphomonadaceae bacterium]
MAALPHLVQRRVDALAAAFFEAPGMARVDFSAPAGAAALFAPDSISWRVMKNPVALMVGGIAAVILELAEPRVRAGVWEHTTFRRDPITRMKRTGYAAMVTVYAPATAARAMIAQVVRAHDRVTGETAEGAPYRANDRELLDWVQATATYGFCEAYRAFVAPLSGTEADRLYAEGAAAAALYGATGAPRSTLEMEALFAAMGPKLQRSEIVFEFLDIVRAAAILPSRSLQKLMVRGAVEITPAWAREALGLGKKFGLPTGGAQILRAIGAAAERVPILAAPPAQACVRMGLRRDYLYR